MPLSCPMAAELALYASCFVCGIVTAASLAITQVTIINNHNHNHNQGPKPRGAALPGGWSTLMFF